MTKPTLDGNEGEHSGAARLPEPLRRRILLWLPALVFGSAGASLLAAAYRLLRPRAGEAAAGGWVEVGNVAQLSGAEPLRREVFFEQQSGWSASTRAQTVFVLPGAGGRVLSASCPHEGCDVEWSAERREFQCPCHDSRFGPDGARLGGPAEHGLARLHSRTNGGALEILLAPSGEDQQAGRVPG